MKPKISIITLGVKDVAIAKAFYESLGFPINEGDGDGEFVMFKMEGTYLALFPFDKLAEDAGVQKAGGFSGVTLARNEASKEEVNASIEEARAAGAEVTKEPEDTFWGGYSGYFKDPDGYLWEVAWNPFTDLT